MAGTPKSTPKKLASASSANGTPAGSPSSTSTPSRMTRAQARATGTKIKTPSPLKKGTSISASTSSTPKSAAKKASSSTPAKKQQQQDDDDEDQPSPSKSKSKSITPSKNAASPKKTSPKKTTAAAAAAAAGSPSKLPASHAKLTRKPTSALATAEPIVAEYSEEEEEDEEEEEEDDDDVVEEQEDEEEDSDLEEGQDVSEKGMQRLMAALGDDGLDEVDMAALDELAGDEDEEDEEQDEEEIDEDEEDEEDEEEQPEEGADIPLVVPNANGDTLAASIARSGLAAAIESEDEQDDSDEEDEEAAEEDEDEEAAIPYEDLPDDIELSEAAKASRTQRIKINNEAALRRIYSDIRLDSPSSSSKLAWIETMRITYPTSISSEVTDVENDLERELAFYKQALHAAVEGKKLVEASGTPFTRPSDFFAEMVKTDEHMERIRQKLLDETAAIKASEAAKKQRELKKFGKKVQVEKLQERIRNKKELNERIQGLKRKHGSNAGGGEDDDGGDDFDVRVEEAISDRPTKKFAAGAAGGGKGGRDPTNKAKMPRSARDAKYGFGGKKKYSKSNTAESTNDFRVGPTRGARGSKPLKGKPTSGKAGFRPKQKSGAAKRPGKARRAGH